MTEFDMNLNSNTQLQLPKSAPLRPIEESPDESVKKMAVLFTDIVGSTKFFKTNGDRAGRKMLRRHQDLVTPIVAKYGGVVVKFLGDSVMAYFFDPREALKSAIKIEQRLRDYRNGKRPQDQIHVRIGIHYGDCIMAEEDIFGDVVNVAAKFLPFVEGDQIGISEELFAQAQDLKGVYFDPAKITSNKDFPNGLSLYRVVWDKAVNLDPIFNIMIYLKPIRELGTNEFEKRWRSLLGEKNKLWAGRVEKQQVFDDRSVALIAKDVPSSLELARMVIGFLGETPGQGGSPLVPIQTVIDVGRYIEDDRVVLEELKVKWEEMEPGAIYVSEPVYDCINKGQTSLDVSTLDTYGDKSFFKIPLNDEFDAEPRLFLFQNALVEGENISCFYCGDRRHLPADCPSKQLNEFSGVLEKLGYLPLEEVNSLFFNALTGVAPEPDLETKAVVGEERSPLWAYYGFYELKMIFQLRFFRKMWDAKETAWSEIKVKKGGGSKGGLVWMAQDCLRISDLGRAETNLKKALRQNPRDWKVYSALGFLNVEKKDFRQARHYFAEALDFSETKSQKVYNSLLLSRTYDLSHDRGRAMTTIRKVVESNPLCLEARYQDVLFQFRNGDNTTALQKLLELIKSDRIYFLHALIDPELADFSKTIHPELNNLLQEARGKAVDRAAVAEEEFEKLENCLGRMDEEVRRARNLLEKIRDLSTAGSYFGSLDIVHYSGSIIQIGRRGVEERKKAVLRGLRELKLRLRECFTSVNNFPYKILVESADRQLRAIQGQVSKHQDTTQSGAPEQMGKTLKEVMGLSSELEKVALKLKGLDGIREYMVFLTKCFKKNVIFQLANLVIAIVLFPMIVYYLNFMSPQLDFSSQEMWVYQKAILVLGGISALLAAVFMASRDTNKR